MEDIEYYYDKERNRTLVIADSEAVSVIPYEDLNASREKRARKEAIEHGPIRNYVNCYHEPIAALNEVLSVDELGSVMKLIPYMRMNTGGHLYYGPDRMDAKLVAKAIGKKIRRTREIIVALFDYGVLTREKVGRSYVYGVNERYHSMGFVIKGALYTKVYQVKTRTDIREVSIQAAGVLYKMIPYFNYAHYYLCVNPDESDEMKIEHLSHRKFAEMVDVNRNTVNNALVELRRHGFVMSVNAYGGQMYRINPDIMFRKKAEFDDYTDSVRKDFVQARRNVEQNGVDLDESDLPY